MVVAIPSIEALAEEADSLSATSKFVKKHGVMKLRSFECRDSEEEYDGGEEDEDEGSSKASSGADGAEAASELDGEATRVCMRALRKLRSEEPLTGELKASVCAALGEENLSDEEIKKRVEAFASKLSSQAKREYKVDVCMSVLEKLDSFKDVDEELRADVCSVLGVSGDIDDYELEDKARELVDGEGGEEEEEDEEEEIASFASLAHGDGGIYAIPIDEAAKALDDASLFGGASITELKGKTLADLLGLSRSGEPSIRAARSAADSEIEKRAGSICFVSEDGMADSPLTRSVDMTARQLAAWINGED